MLVNNGGNYTKHVYIGSQRIVSKLASSDIFNVSPVNTSDLKLKYTQLTSKIKERYDSLGVNYKGTEVTGGTGLIAKVVTVDCQKQFQIIYIHFNLAP